MINLKSFIAAIHDALFSASDALFEKNQSFLNKYFVETDTTNGIISDNINAKGNDGVKPDLINSRKTLVPKTVILEYPHSTADGSIEKLQVFVPLITLVPFALAQIDKATFTAFFEMEEIDGDLQLNFTNKSSGTLFRKKPKTAKLELTLTQQETPEGLKLLIEGYEAILKRQIA